MQWHSLKIGIDASWRMQFTLWQSPHQINSVDLSFPFKRDTMQFVTKLYNQVDEEVHGLLLLSNKCLWQLGSLGEAWELEEDYDQVIITFKEFIKQTTVLNIFFLCLNSWIYLTLHIVLLRDNYVCSAMNMNMSNLWANYCHQVNVSSWSNSVVI